MINASLFIGWCITLLWLPSFADKGGRKKYFWAGQAIDLILYIGLCLTKDLLVMILIWTAFGAMSTIRI